MNEHTGLVIFLLLLSLNACNDSRSLQSTVPESREYLNNYSTFTGDNRINIIVEIPAGTDQKWEVNKDSGLLEWERISPDSLRIVKFLPYPANYGFVPQTFLPAADGGDGDPLDVFLLGPAVDRGKVVPARLIGMIKMLDAGEQDDKLIAVADNSHFGSVKTFNELRTNYPGVLEILDIWLSHYKGNKTVVIQSFEDEQSALKVLNAAVQAFHQEKKR